MDSLRLAIEKCDSLGRMLAVTESFGFWGGLSYSFLEAAKDDLGVRVCDTVALFTGLGGIKGGVADKAMNLSSFNECSSRVLPLCMNDSGELDPQALCQIGGLLETFVTPDLFPRLETKNMPFGLANVGFGTCPEGVVPEVEIKDWTTHGTFKKSSNLNQWRVGRADNPGSEDDYLDVSIYLADIENSSLRYPPIFHV